MFKVEKFTDETLNLIYITPELVDFDANKLISFELYVRDTRLNFEVGTMNDPTDIDSFEPYEIIVAEDMLEDDWKEFTIDFKNYTGNSKHIAFRPRKNLNHYLSLYPHNGSISFDNFRYFDDAYIIKGLVRNDAQSDGCDVTDLAIPNVKISTDDGTRKISRFTNREGEYDFYPTQGSYTVSPEDISPYFTFFPGSTDIELNEINTIEDIEFCLKPNGIHPDLELTLIPTIDARPGFDTTYKLIYENVGTTILSGTINLQYDYEKLNFKNAQPSTTANTASSLSWSYESLNPFESKSISIKFNVYAPPITSISEKLSFTAEGIHNSVDETPENNTFILNTTIIGSYDPNDKTVLEGPEIATNELDKYLHYVIRFQNTGTASAINVRIEDELDPNLDWSTFLPLEMSHEGTIEITDDSKVEFIFNDINLPHEALDSEGSNGYLSFKIKPKSDIVAGSLIKGKADIYFDFNPPIITNEVITEVVEELPLTINSFSVTALSCYESADGVIEIAVSGGAEPYTYELYNDTNNTLLTAGNTNIFQNLSSGSYYTVVIDANSNQIQSSSIEITEPPALTAMVSVTGISCVESNNAIATFTASGGLPATYQYALNGGAYSSSNTFENLSIGNYTATIRDENGCQVHLDFTIDSPAPITAEINATEVSCANSNDGSIAITASGGTSPFLYSLDGATFSSQPNFSNLSTGVYDVIIQDANGCFVTITTTISKETNCLDFTLPANNFTIETTSESCASSNNGIILVRAEENLNYTVTLDGEIVTETKAFKTFVSFQDLEAGSYELCITVASEADYKKCFTIQITEPDELEVDSKIDQSGKTVSLSLKGGTNYFINLNGTEYSTSKNQIILPLSKVENSIIVKTDLECQGIYEESILAPYDSVSIFPNPVEKGDVTILLPPNNVSEEVLLTLFSQNGIRVLEKIEKPVGRTVKINMDDLPSGIYTIIITTETQNSMRKIIKK